MRGRICSFQLLPGIAKVVFLGLSPAGIMSIIFLSFMGTQRDKKKMGVAVRDTTLGVRGQENNVFRSGGSQAVPDSPSGGGTAYDKD
jgi:hypothetical protein